MTVLFFVTAFLLLFFSPPLLLPDVFRFSFYIFLVDGQLRKLAHALIVLYIFIRNRWRHRSINGYGGIPVDAKGQVLQVSAVTRTYFFRWGATVVLIWATTWIRGFSKHHKSRLRCFRDLNTVDMSGELDALRNEAETLRKKIRVSCL